MKTKLILKRQNLEKIPTLPHNLKIFNCSHNNITKIENLPKSLQVFICSGNLISKIENLPENLRKFICIGDIKYTYDFYDLVPEDKKNEYFGVFRGDFVDYKAYKDEFYKLKEQDPRYQGNGNFLTKIENLPESLEYFNCSNNEIRYIENLPDNLKYFICDGNYIEKIENLPESLEYFRCVPEINYRSSYYYSDEDFNDHFYEDPPVISVIENLPKNLKEFEYDARYIEYIDNITLDYFEKYDMYEEYGEEEMNGHPIVFDLEWYNPFKRLQRRIRYIYSEKMFNKLIKRYEDMKKTYTETYTGLTHIRNLIINIYEYFN